MLICLTASHRNASFDLLERLSIGAPAAASHLVTDSDVLDGAVVLATCNRFEAYLDIAGDDDAAVRATVEAVSAASELQADEVLDAVQVLGGGDVVQHLFAVSSGLESVVVGETEISGQVRRALEDARRNGTTTSDLERLFQEAAHTSRGVKTRTRIGAAGRSLVRLGLELASSRITDWAATRVLLVGTGSYAATTIAALRDRGAQHIQVFSPSGRAPWFAAKHDLVAATDLRTAIGTSDVVITCTSSEVPVVEACDLDDGARRIVIDLGLPRNVHPDAADVEGVELLDLETISIHAPIAELNAETEARAIVDDAVSRFRAQALEQSTTPALVALRKHVFDILDDEIDRVKRRGDTTPESAEQTERALRHLVGVLLHRPSVRARELGRAGRGDDFTGALDALFGVRPEPVADVPSAVVPLADRAARVRDDEADAS
ncbi:glutamyl-tRNA reductase [Curtobacterium sp. MCJR17_055]|uniref:glutamyl-tRNA reductase n=1 Tax=unclassified Curtobacterium TaxID=257496 RepID=UPI000D8FAF7B|nr:MULTISPECIES: glutamyl-tRNA reductase [unclassified Curtobacterium]PYY37959.1 glutamyl-tRNA reductase [Curtobacterium sp. MCBD17_029]PYY56985.1 glutamyl-tRNA reductase [Curtobacterium sp. MCJR17_055]PYY62099.1 glutamyl-tRNA reductase [Curtobacterium sp. MCPF17_015]PZE86969.1 glutamyl-tRNA reductase [Curtobacterium sp. MCBD17_032]PZE94151.1 glutamyl-tRNA reductase [Curtobacterium sp. MCBD17_008]